MASLRHGKLPTSFKRSLHKCFLLLLLLHELWKFASFLCFFSFLLAASFPRLFVAPFLPYFFPTFLLRFLCFFLAFWPRFVASCHPSFLSMSLYFFASFPDGFVSSFVPDFCLRFCSQKFLSIVFYPRPAQVSASLIYQCTSNLESTFMIQNCTTI